MCSYTWWGPFLNARDSAFPSCREQTKEALWWHTIKSFTFSHCHMILSCLRQDFFHLCQFSKRVVCCHNFQFFFFLCNYCALALVAFPSWLLISGTVPLTFGCWIYDLGEVITFHFLFLQFLVFQITWLPAIILWMQAWALPLQVRVFFPSDFDITAFLAEKYSEIIPIYQFLSYSSSECQQLCPTCRNVHAAMRVASQCNSK